MKLLIAQIVVAGLLIVGTAALIKTQYNKIIDLETELTTAQDTVARQAMTIDRLTKQAVIDERTVTQFVAGLNALREAAEAQTQAITDLEKTDPDVKAYLSTPIPSGLIGVLGNRDARAGSTAVNPSR